MAFEQEPGVAETSNTSGAGSYSLAGAISARRTFAAAHASGATVYCRVARGTDWEEGLYTFTAPSTLARTAILRSTNGNAAVSWPDTNEKTIKEIPIALSAASSTVKSGLRTLLGLAIGIDVQAAGSYAASGANSDITSLSALASVNEGPLAGWRNLLINPDGRFLERAPASNADNTYGHDRWVALTQTSTIAVSTVSDAESGTPRMARLTQSQASAQRMGYAQWIEGANCRWLRGKNVTLSGRIKFSLNAAVRYAICEWTGTEDTPSTARDIVNDWTSGTFTAGNFFKSTTFNVLGVGTITPSAATLTDLTKLTAAVGSSCNNLVVFIWTEGTAAQNATLDIALQLEVGSVASRREFRPQSVEQALCEWYYLRKTFSANFDFTMVGFGNSGASQNYTDHYPPMRKDGMTGALSSTADFNIAVNGTSLAASSLSCYRAGRRQAVWTTTASFTAGFGCQIFNANGATGWLSYDGEI